MKQTDVTDSIIVTQNVDDFFQTFNKTYTENPDYGEYLLVLVLAKMHEHKNPHSPAVVFNFFWGLECTSRVAFDFYSGNLIGPSLRTMQCRNAADRSPPYIHCNEENIVNRIKNTLVSTADCSSGLVAINLSFDKLPKVLSLNYTNKGIVGIAYPNHWIPVDGKDEEWIKAKLGSDSDVI